MSKKKKDTEVTAEAEVEVTEVVGEAQEAVIFDEVQEIAESQVEEIKETIKASEIKKADVLADGQITEPGSCYKKVSE